MYKSQLLLHPNHNIGFTNSSPFLNGQTQMTDKRWRIWDHMGEICILFKELKHVHLMILLCDYQLDNKMILSSLLSCVHQTYKKILYILFNLYLILHISKWLYYTRERNFPSKF